MMKPTSLFFALAVGATTVLSAAVPGWAPPGLGDVRGPCPMLNTLANHGFLPHTGKGISLDNAINALDTALNIDSSFAKFLFNKALTTNPTPNATTIDLNMLSRHNILEHDASISRQDAYFGPADVFDEAVFNQTLTYFTGDIITMQMASNARVVRLLTSNLTNPEYEMSVDGEFFSLGETVAYVAVLGDKKSMTVPKNYVEYFFRNQRLPYELGFSRMTERLTQQELFTLAYQLSDLESFPQSPGNVFASNKPNVTDFQNGVIPSFSGGSKKRAEKKRIEEKRSEKGTSGGCPYGFA
ncbi:Cloroperoxidase [Hypoxylon trugodes]|uniref:Cloroperoxidase n=1 Tax=Hypoxylon trugodes TaxID=326681 RepID=UPI00219740A7|nr:Cloroperoxidase [Hypoxylon trugodes]KAI1393030.1 Cloroperoxidase [Hypoxylon trugodes]